MVSVRASFSVSFSGIEEVDKVDKEEDETEGRGSRRIWFIVNGSDSGGGGGGGGGRISPGMNVAVDELEAKAEAEIEKFCVATIRPVWVEQIWPWPCLPEVCEPEVGRPEQTECAKSDFLEHEYEWTKRVPIRILHSEKGPEDEATRRSKPGLHLCIVYPVPSS